MDSHDLPASVRSADIDYSRYRFTACIDWISIKVKLTRSSNFFTIKKHFGLSYVEGLNETPSLAASEFEFRIYDVNNWTELQKYLDAIEKEFGFSVPPEISGVEISFDGYSKANNHDELVSLAAHFYKFVARPFSENRRFYNQAIGSAYRSNSQRHIDTLKSFQEGKTAAIGSQSEDARTQRIYVKTTDKKEKLLSHADYRARYEITLVGDQCPFRTMDEATAFKFQSLSKLFSFRRPKPGAAQLIQDNMEYRAYVGYVKPVRRKAGGMRENNPQTMADTELNEIAYDCLRNLTLRLT